MKKWDIGQTIQIIANLGVVAGIIFLGVELRQNNDLLEYDRRLSALELQLSAMDLALENEDLRIAIGKANFGEELSPSEEGLIGIALSKNFQILEWQFLENQLSSEDIRRTISQGFPIEKARDVFDSMTDSLDPEFVRVVEQAFKQAFSDRERGSIQ